MLLSCRLQRHVVAVVTILYLPILAGDAPAQVIQRAVGGVLINPGGVLQSAPATVSAQNAEEMKRWVGQVAKEFRTPGASRGISLRGLDAVLRQIQSPQEIPAEIRFLGGLQRIDAILVDPEHQDVILVGPSDEWTIHPSGDLVGATTGRPVLMLDDLLVALRSVDLNRDSGITCSIDPTPQGRQALESLLATLRRFEPGVAQRIEQTLGDQVVTIAGVPTDTHFAAVLAAADFQMKCYAMHLQPAPIAELPSFLQLVQARRSVAKNLMPRWWLAVEYEVPACSPDRLVWSIGASTVKVLTEDEIVAADGSVTGTGKSNPLAKRWADSATARYGDLARADVVFARLHQVMDWALIAAVIDHYDLMGTAGCELPLLTKVDSPLKTEAWVTPQSVPTHASFVRVGRQFVITASGGVDIDPWRAIAHPRTDTSLQMEQRQPKHQLASWCQDFE
jgi:hypothetical protein